MLLEWKRKANRGVAVLLGGFTGVAIVVFSSRFFNAPENPVAEILRSLAVIAFAGGFWYAIYAYGGAKGYGAWILILPIFSVLGLAIILLLKDKCPSGVTLAPDGDSTSVIVATTKDPTPKNRAWHSALHWVASHRRRVILVVAAALYVISMLYAPWVVRGSERVLRVITAEGVSLIKYGPIFSIPNCVDISGGLPCRYELNLSLLLAQWLFIAIFAAIAWFWNKD